MTDSSTTQMLGVGIATLRELRAAVLAATDRDAAVSALREAGYAGGDAVHAAFEQWLTESGAASSDADSGASRADAGDLTLDDFGQKAAKFFRDAGWGEVTFSQDEAEGVALIDIEGCWEAAADTVGSGCQITTGLLAAFFGRIAGYPVAVLETECAAADGDGSRCRFMLGNSDVMNYRWEEMRGGES